MIEFPHLYKAGAPAGTPPEVISRVFELERAQSAAGVEPIYSLRHLAHLSDVGYTFLRQVAAREIDAYVVYEIRKRDGRSMRSIAAPDERLQIAQRWLLDNVFSRFETHRSSFAYQVGRSARKCAEVHVGSSWMLHFDLRDFFHQSDERDAFRLLVQHNYSRLVSFELARLVTRMPTTRQSWLPRKYSEEPTPRAVADFPYLPRRLGYVPQGAPTSGALTNALALALDQRLEAIASDLDLVYSRYADDLTLSSSAKFTRSHAARAAAALSSAIAGTGYELNASKTRVILPGRRMEVLGMLVDGSSVRLTVRTRKRIEFHLRGIEEFGLESHRMHAGFRDSVSMLHFLHGLIDYAWDVEPTRASTYRDRLALIAPI